MSRIEAAFQNRFRQLLGEIGARDREKGVRLLFEKSNAFQSSGLSISQSLAKVNARLAQQVNTLLARRGTPRRPPARIICDAGLGGLARWLRASGDETHWTQDITDQDLVDEARRLEALIITTDSPLLDRRVITHGEVHALWVPPSLTKFEQLELLRAELNLTSAESRCMRCGGELIEVDKEAVKERIPPKTYLWVNEYFECTRCRQLFWHGTHWQKISRRLNRAGDVTSP